MGLAGVALAQQANVATTAHFAATWVDIHVPEGVVRGDWPDGPLPISPTVLAPNGGLLGSIHVWVAAGALTAIEQGWVTDAAPDDWPTVDQLQWP
jgi:hypothetical protein